MNQSPGAAGDDQESWEDLSLNRPGKAVRERARVELEKMRRRSRLLADVVRVLAVHTEERAWRLGAKGEEFVGLRLDRLKAHGWYVLHSVPVGVGDSDIDHLLIGPGGVVTVNTKHHPGKRIWVAAHQVRVAGQPVPYLRNAEYEADRVSRILTRRLGWQPRVRPAIVFLTRTVIPAVTVKQRPPKVLILDRLDIPRAIRRLPPQLTDAQAAEIFEVARRSTTWK